MHITSLIAAEFDGMINNTDFWETGLGKMLGTAMGVVGIIIVVYAVMKTVKNVASGKVGDAVKGVVGAVLIAAVLFQPTLIQSAIRAGGNVVQQAIDTVSSIGGSGGTPTVPSTPAESGGGGDTPLIR